MIFLFEQQNLRAKMINPEGAAVAIFVDEEWQLLANGAEKIKVSGRRGCFLVHHSNSQDFEKRLEEWKSSSLELPVIYFTGGDPSGKPLHEHWIRYRAISLDCPFTAEELMAIDRWAIAGCKDEEAPWVCRESQPHFLRGLLLLVMLAESVLNGNKAGFGDRKVLTRGWWQARLSVEENWREKIEGEFQWRRPSGHHLLQSFLDWIDKDGSDCAGKENSWDESSSSLTDNLTTLRVLLMKVSN